MFQKDLCFELGCTSFSCSFGVAIRSAILDYFSVVAYYYISHYIFLCSVNASVFMVFWLCVGRTNIFAAHEWRIVRACAHVMRSSMVLSIAIFILCFVSRCICRMLVFDYRLHAQVVCYPSCKCKVYGVMGYWDVALLFMYRAYVFDLF